MRLIDADALIFEIWETTIQPEWCKVLTDKVIRNQPTVDAVPVIRCKDCASWRQMSGTYGECYDGLGDGRLTSEDDFCSFAKSGVR